VAILPDAGASTRPLADAAQRFLGPAGGIAIALAALVPRTAIERESFALPRAITFALADQGDFPRFWARFIQIPDAARFHLRLCGSGFCVRGTGELRWNAILSAVSRLTVYGAMALAVPLLRRRSDRQAHFVLPWPYLFAGLGLIFSLLLPNPDG